MGGGGGGGGGAGGAVDNEEGVALLGGGGRAFPLFVAGEIEDTLGEGGAGSWELSG